ncbi:hypothetical protein RE428_31740 [Marinobacter nanhaiticus D15-8W]|uniref:Right-handed parallel beta-helix repeat-containing protein n=1 Tax=Marinobacter nanhaiticus D15-8W TaxID=626887 RepID=N6X0G3_9GAMM|nr:hypothetical protein [Marinobacter nanhaiticus]ENO16932.1 hypothetical protein J057_01635 [Marinobacter nanhaiticus D15-8W]BES72156.1 hypothetical protein RE428_31740 [Marinobacter nanhaiticus D15-8W]
MSSTVTDRIQGLSTSVAMKAPVKDYTTGNITRAGLGVQAGGNWATDLVTGDRILVKDQTDAADNGIYIADTSDWYRARDFDGRRDVTQGTLVSVASTGKQFRVITPDPISIGVTGINFAVVPRDDLEGVDSVHDLFGADPSANPIILVRSYHPNSSRGGGYFYWESSRSKAEHNGITIISPTVPSVTLQPGSTVSEKTASFHAGTGETDVGGAGCFVKSSNEDVDAFSSGALPGNGDQLQVLQNGVNVGSPFIIEGGQFEIDLQDQASGIGIVPRSGHNIVWRNGGSIKILPNDLDTYFGVYMNGRSGVRLVDPVIVGEKDEHLGATGESGMLIGMYSSTDIEISNPTLSGAWGDAIYMGADAPNNPGSLDITGVAKISDCRRQGISVIHCDRLTADTVIISDISGTDPSYGIDFEPNNSSQRIQGVHIKTVVTRNTLGGIGIALRQLRDSSDPVDIRIDNLVDYDSLDTLRTDLSSTSAPGGKISFGSIKSYRSGNSALLIRRHYSGGPWISADHVYIEDANENDQGAIDGAPINLLTLSGECIGKPLGNISLLDVTIERTAAGGSTLPTDISIRDTENDEIRRIEILNVASDAVSLLDSASQTLVEDSGTVIVTRQGENFVRSGSNANGEWTKHPDGTMTCRAKITLTFSSGEATWTLPAAFINNEYIYGCFGANGDRDNLIVPWFSSLQNETQCKLRRNVDGTVDVMLYAEGRWRE